MGKRHRHHHKVETISAEKEKEKIRNSILQVFRARLASPGGGGAIVVGKNNTDTDQPTNIPKTPDEPVSVSSSSMSDRDDSPVIKSSRKKYRRKARSKAKHTKKTEKEKSDITKRIKMVNDIRTALKPDSSQTNRKISLITHNRLTNKLGLFNPGRKSETISRKIQVSDAVRKKTQEDLKKILSHDDNDENNPVDIDVQLNSPSRPVHFHMRNNTKQDIGYYSKGSNHSVITPLAPSNKQTVTTGSTSCLSIASIDSEDGLPNLPESPPYEETAEILLSALKPKRFFPGRNLFYETIQELQTIMRKNAPISATPVSSNSAKLKIASDSVKRSLLDRYPPSASSTKSDLVVPDDTEMVVKSNTSQNTAKKCVHSDPITVTHDRHKEALMKMSHDSMFENYHKSRDLSHGRSCDSLNRSKFYEKDYSCTKVAVTEDKVKQKTEKLYVNYHTDIKDGGVHHRLKTEKYCNMRDGGDGRSLLKSNDVAAMIVEISDQSTVVSEPMDIDYNTDARDILKHNDRALEYSNGSRNSSQCVVSMDTNMGNHSNSLHVNSSQSSGYQGSQQSKAVITEFREHPEFMPTFHSGYYQETSRHGRSKSVPVSEVESMDILDYLDHGYVDPSSYNRATSRLKSTTPDSDGSPLWLPPEPLLQHPPRLNLDSLSPPKKLYPRRLY